MGGCLRLAAPGGQVPLLVGSAKASVLVTDELAVGECHLDVLPIVSGSDDLDVRVEVVGISVVVSG